MHPLTFHQKILKAVATILNKKGLEQSEVGTNSINEMLSDERLGLTSRWRFMADCVLDAITQGVIVLGKDLFYE